MEGFEKEADTREGWAKPMPGMPAFMKGEWIITAETLKKYVSGLDLWNPF